MEKDVFQNGDCLRNAALHQGHQVLDWSDEWWFVGLPKLQDPVVFHGALANADRLAKDKIWNPGAYCRTGKFHCTFWYEAASRWLLHRKWVSLPASKFILNAAEVLSSLECMDAAFVRPDSPLKPFSGRILQLENISWSSLDFGFYFDDPELPIVVAPVRNITREWRYVVVNHKVVAGSAYQAATRTALPDKPDGQSWVYASEIARELQPPDPVYIMDICEADGDLWLLELNPFSGADLYACDGDAIVNAISGFTNSQSRC